MKQMKEKGIEPNNFMLTSLISAYAKVQSSGNAAQAT